MLSLKKAANEQSSFGYINRQKKYYLCKTIIITIISLLIFVVGYYLNKKSNANIFTVIAILGVLPGAKAFVGFVVFFPYKSVDKSRFDAMINELPDDKIHFEFMADAVFTSPDKVMNLDFIYMDHAKLIGLIGKKNQNISYIQEYLEKGMRNRGYHCHVQILTDEKQFRKMIRSMKREENLDEKVKLEQQEIYDYMKSLMVN